MTGEVAATLRSLQFKALSVIATVMGRRVAYHHVHDLLVPSLHVINKELYVTLNRFRRINIQNGVKFTDNDNT